ncbi:MAG: peptide chain release factor N(5)-glutamine methyltransferase [Magnetococcales bacterium]|nr:peptide chain release factor N(5)-glutamine methyltransferase [Magnetococcales bacterium]
MTAPLWTVRTLLGWSAPWLAQRGVESSRLDSELLLASVLNLRRLDLFLDPHRPLMAQELAAFKAVVKRRAAREPVAYILGRREFWSMAFLARGDVLIPRPETELLVESVLARYPDRSAPLEILELCTGSGVILCALLTEYPMATGVGTDLSPAALELARDNLAQHGLTGRVALLEGDLTAPVAQEARFDLVLANPPYIASDTLAGLEPEVRDWEPRLALDGGAEGLSVLSRIPPLARTRLRPGGWLLTEIGWDQGEAVADLLARAGFVNIEILNDYNKLPRVVAGNVPA